jgi:hypothetical protein
MIYGTPGYSADFDFFDGMSNNVAVCDIDACYTNNIPLPTIHDEQMYIRILNVIINFIFKLFLTHPFLDHEK